MLLGEHRAGLGADFICDITVARDAISAPLILSKGADASCSKRSRIRWIAQKRLTAVGRVAAKVLQISLNSVRRSSWFFAFESRTPNATPIAAVTPMAGAPRTIMSRI